MTPIAKGISAVLIAIGIFLILIQWIIHQETIKSTLVGEVQEESEGKDQKGSF